MITREYSIFELQFLHIKCDNSINQVKFIEIAHLQILMYLFFLSDMKKKILRI
jgi:hypothetical protein